MVILDLGYRDVWLMLIDGWSTLIDVWLTLTDSLLCIRYPYCNIFPSHWWDLFRQLNKGEWLVLVVYLMDLTSNIILWHICCFSLKYSWDWDSYRIDFKFSISLELPMIYDIRTFLHDFVKIKVDHIRFHLRSIDGFFSQTFMR